MRITEVIEVFLTDDMIDELNRGRPLRFDGYEEALSGKSLCLIPQKTPPVENGCSSPLEKPEGFVVTYTDGSAEKIMAECFIQNGGLIDFQSKGSCVATVNAGSVKSIVR